uniref:EGF-like domain-containing protein n=1 Tax=Amphiprion percula TaxID=161767 RepID=A0A3P8SBR9_AMPPE
SSKIGSPVFVVLATWVMVRCASTLMNVSLASAVNCHPHAKCHPYQGSFYCQCAVGFEGNGTNCWDVDECDQSQDEVCPAFSYCFNTNGSYICSCWEGFQTNDTQCQNIDECATGNFTCPDNSTCTDLEGSYTCTCDPGFSGNRSLCLDINECSLGLIQCPNFSNCINMVGSSVCECWEGYQGNMYPDNRWSTVFCPPSIWGDELGSRWKIDCQGDHRPPGKPFWN